jgi:hypothetical protein
MTQVLARVVPVSLMAVVTRSGEFLELENHLPAAMGVPPGAVATGRTTVDQRELGRSRTGFNLLVVFRVVRRPASGMRDRPSVRAGEREVVGGRGVPGGLVGEIAHLLGVDRPGAAQDAGPAGQLRERGHRRGQMDPGRDPATRSRHVRSRHVRSRPAPAAPIVRLATVIWSGSAGEISQGIGLAKALEKGQHAQSVHVAVDAALLQHAGAGIDQPVHPEHRDAGQFPAGDHRVATIFGPDLDPGLPGGVLAAFAGGVGIHFNDGAGNPVAQHAVRHRLNVGVSEQDTLGLAGLGRGQAGAVGADRGRLALVDHPIAQFAGCERQFYLEIPRQAQQVVGGAPVHGQSEGQLPGGVLGPHLRHGRRTTRLTAWRRTAPDDLRDHRQPLPGLTGLQPAPCTEHAKQLVVGHGSEVAGNAGGVIGTGGQRCTGCGVSHGWPCPNPPPGPACTPGTGGAPGACANPVSIPAASSRHRISACSASSASDWAITSARSPGQSRRSPPGSGGRPSSSHDGSSSSTARPVTPIRPTPSRPDWLSNTISGRGDRVQIARLVVPVRGPPAGTLRIGSCQFKNQDSGLRLDVTGAGSTLADELP